LKRPLVSAEICGSDHFILVVIFMAVIPPLRKLEYLLAVARELHFGKAAERLHVDQSHISREVKALEKEFEFTVFTRANHFVAITEEAGPFIMDLEQALARFVAEFERAQRLARLRARDRGHRDL
jgi:DNA-binding transcriptional LysR family regulator